MSATTQNRTANRSPVHQIGASNEQDQYGGLGQASLDDAGDDWNSYTIARDAFESVWDSAGE